MAKGGGLCFFKFSIAFLAIALLSFNLLSPSFVGRSNKITGMRQLMQCAAIWAPITPEPNIATLPIGIFKPM